jgi:hypothetical protein
MRHGCPHEGCIPCVEKVAPGGRAPDSSPWFSLLLQLCSATMQPSRRDFVGIPAGSACCAVQECETCGAAKLVLMFSVATAAYSPRWFLKVEDSVYVSPSHAVAASYQWGAMNAEYIGCLRHKRPVDWTETAAKQDPDRDMIAWHYHAHARKAAYAVSGDVVRLALVPNAEVLRPLKDEGASWPSLHEIAQQKRRSGHEHRVDALLRASQHSVFDSRHVSGLMLFSSARPPCNVMDQRAVTQLQSHPAGIWMEFLRVMRTVRQV